MSPRKLATSSAKSAVSPKNKGSESEMAEAILAELFELLEEYGPFWYTEELHTRAKRALSGVAKRKVLTLIPKHAGEKGLARAAMERLAGCQSEN